MQVLFVLDTFALVLHTFPLLIDEEPVAAEGVDYFLMSGAGLLIHLVVLVSAMSFAE